MNYLEWCDSIVNELLNDEWYQKTSSKERILDQIKEFADDLKFYFGNQFSPADVAGRWWAITM